VGDGLAGSEQIGTANAQVGSADCERGRPAAAPASALQRDCSAALALRWRRPVRCSHPRAQVDLADARAAQTGQALAYPFNILLLADPLTCTQVGARLLQLPAGTMPRAALQRGWHICC
jgi:hypothetical protein